MGARSNTNKEERTIVSLQLISGGKDNPPPTGNWLADLPVGTRFSVMDLKNPSNFMTIWFEVVRKTDLTIRLWTAPVEDPNGGQFFGDILPVRFTSLYGKVEVILPTEKEEQYGEVDRLQGESDGA